jgi:hypothetical protein
MTLDELKALPRHLSETLGLQQVLMQLQFSADNIFVYPHAGRAGRMAITIQERRDTEPMFAVAIRHDPELSAQEIYESWLALVLEWNKTEDSVRGAFVSWWKDNNETLTLMQALIDKGLTPWSKAQA